MTLPKHITPIDPAPTENTTRWIDRAHGGSLALPVVDVPGGHLVCFIPSKKALKALRRYGSALVLMRADDGSISMAVHEKTIAGQQ